MREIKDLGWALILILLVLVTVMINSDEANARPTWYTSEASYYTLYGNRTACGLTMSRRSWHVAALVRDDARCGLKLTICHRRRCVRVRVMDRGAYRTDGRRWDLAPRVRDSLRCGDLCNVRWRYGYE